MLIKQYNTTENGEYACTGTKLISLKHKKKYKMTMTKLCKLCGGRPKDVYIDKEGATYIMNAEVASRMEKFIEDLIHQKQIN